MSGLRGKHILLIITGGIAAYKAIELVRQIQKAGGSVQPILTRSATQFVTPLTLSAISGYEALTDLFDLTREAKIGHIELSRSADLIVVAPATADFMAKMANGLADDLASTTILATDTPILIAPAMNVRMWEAAATRRNLATLVDDGVRVVGPDEGEMACGEYGPGRMAEPDAIVAAIENQFAHVTKPLGGRHIVVTSGPTREWIDPVRYISNASSGKQGSAIAEALSQLGAKVSFVTGPADHAKPQGCEIIKVVSARDMHAAVKAALPADAAVFCAAVADWRAADAADEKLKKVDGKGPDALSLVANPDILAEISQMPAGQRPSLCIGFAAETESLIENAAAKLSRKGCDVIVANDVSRETGTFGGDDNHVVVISAEGHDDWGRLSKREIGHRLAELIADRIGKRQSAD